MKFLTLIYLLFLTACSVQIVEMTPEPTEQVFDLTDSEADGIISARDECPKSLLGAKVGNNGCGSYTIEKVRLKLEVNFETDSYVVEKKYYPEIEKLADFMTLHPKADVTIEGHTSIRGKAAYNMTLSQNRADAIQDILISEFNIDGARIKAIGFGFTQLLLTGNDDYIHAKNRRIVAEISGDNKLHNMKWTIYSVDDLPE